MTSLMSQELLLILGVIAGGFFFLILFVNRKIQSLSNQQKPSEELIEWLKSTNQRFDDQTKNLSQSLIQNTRALNERLDNAARIIASVQRSVGEVSEIGRSMRELQEFLRSPKLRGNVGEQVLTELLTQMLPRQSFHLQYEFKSGVTVDAAVKTSGGIIPIDSKFPMENFRKMTEAEKDEEKRNYQKDFLKDIKNHIDSISKKYILTDEGTIDYALMYIPSESIYYELCSHEDLMDYAYQKRVLPVSPTTFYAYLKAILMSFEGQKIEARARKILAAIRAVQKDYGRVEDKLNVLNKHIGNAYNTMSEAISVFVQLGQKISSTQNLGEQTKDEAQQLEVGE